MSTYIPKTEQETVIRYDRCSNTATVYTCDSTMITKLRGLIEHGEGYTLVRQDDVSMTVRCPKALIRFRSKRRSMSDEQRAAARERMMRLNGKNDDWED